MHIGEWIYKMYIAKLNAMQQAGCRLPNTDIPSCNIMLLISWLINIINLKRSYFANYDRKMIFLIL